MHIEDLADAYVLAAAKPSIGEILHLVDSEPVRLADFAKSLVEMAGGGRAMGMPKWFVSMLAGPPLVEMLTASLRADNTKARRVLAWVPRYPSVRDGLPSVLAAC